MRRAERPIRRAPSAIEGAIRGHPDELEARTIEQVGVGSSALFLLSMTGVFGFFWWGSRPSQLRRSAEARQELRWLDRGRDVDQDIAYMHRLFAFVMLPFGGLCVGLAAATFVYAVMTA